MKNTKRALACLVGAVMLSGSITAFAKEEAVFKGYDVTDNAINSGRYAKIYDIYDRGAPTGKEIVDGYATKVEWKLDFYEESYPHAGYERLYLDDTRTSAIRATNTIAPWEQKFVDDTWEIKYPYKIYSALYTNIPGKGFVKNIKAKTQEKYHGDIYAYSGKNAAVNQEYKYFGFAGFRVIGDNKVETAFGEMIKFGVIPNRLDLNGALSVDSLSAPDENNNYKMTDYDIAKTISRYNSEYLTGPDFAKGGTKTINTYEDCFSNVSKAERESRYKAAYKKYLLDTIDYNAEKDKALLEDKEFTKEAPVEPTMDFGRDAVNYNDEVIKASEELPSIGWTNPQFEQYGQYRYYQILIIDGVVMDGRALEGGEYLPYIFRYTNGIATPKVEWKFETVEAAYPYAAYERKYLTDVDGKVYATNDVRANGEYGKLIGKAVYNDFSGKFDYKIWYNGTEYEFHTNGKLDPTVDVPFEGNVADPYIDDLVQSNKAKLFSKTVN